MYPNWRPREVIQLAQSYRWMSACLVWDDRLSGS